jgi:hypothetical protein
MGILFRYIINGLDSAGLITAGNAARYTQSYSKLLEYRRYLGRDPH